jgi:hypothetical protein
MFNKKYENEELNTILTLVQKDPIFFDNEKRLLSQDEILNYKEELKTNLDIIPLVDLYDNNYLVYNLTSNKYQLLDISQDLLWKDIESIADYIKSIENYLNK